MGVAMRDLGSNLGYVDELYSRFLADPASVSEAWREFFADYRPFPESPPAQEPAAPAKAAPGAPAPEVPEGAQPFRGVAARIVENMEASLAVPTATSTRTVPVKLLEENRRLINLHQGAVHGLKVSYTHLIAWSIVRALEKHPAMNAGFLSAGGAPHRIPRAGINLGIAIDIERRGERILLVPCLKDAGRLSFPAFAKAYDELVLRSRQGKLAPEELKGTTVTLTNPGMIGTVMSVPRLMVGQGTIVGVGAIGYPAQYAGMAPRTISELGLSKVMTVTSTYDHRIIQGAESGQFLADLERLLLGEDGFYGRIFEELGVPHEPVGWSGDQSPTAFGGTGSTEAIEKQARVIQLIRSYRIRGHLLADLDPLGYDPRPHADLELSHYGFTLWDLDRKFIAGDLAGSPPGILMTLREILDILRETYSRKIGVEFMHIPEPEIRGWLQGWMERTRNAEPLPPRGQERILASLNAAEVFERFLHSTYIGHKRFSLEGGETLIPMLDFLLAEAATAGAEEVIIGMAHRGRLNVISNIVGKSYGWIFRQFEGVVDPVSSHGSGDVKYHLGATGMFRTAEGGQIRVSVASNPSHLEAVDPVVEGMARARQDWLGDSNRERAVPVLIHGDAAFAGQGVVAETLNLSQLKGYRTGGTIHIIVNNQIGFTTGPADARSSLYTTDVAKMVRAPIFHVNGDSPEAAVRAIRLAFAFRKSFKRDVVVDLVCYRRWGHNEADEPSYTHPLLYAKIEKHRSVRKLYTEELLGRGDFDVAKAEESLNDFRDRLERAFTEVRQAKAEAPPPAARVERQEPDGEPGGARTAASPEVLVTVLEGLDRIPEGFHLHPKLAKSLSGRRDRFRAGKIDWALGEALAFGSLLLEGTPVRLSGEDSGRGTFSHRHAILYDHQTGSPHVPLNHLRRDQAPFHIFDSLLSELAVVGFEYGYSVNYPEALVIWEAQFGDFVNGAQAIFDQFIASAEDKWGQKSGLVLLLPHGYEGQGPDHSSARPERILQLAARDNIRFSNPTTPAQYFHLLRRQVKETDRKPLIVLTPKSLLRHPEAVSPAAALTAGGFELAIDDPRSPDPSSVRRVILTSGKIFYEIESSRWSSSTAGVAVVRLEQYYPFPASRVAAILARYSSAADVAWVQEEPRNMGAWTFLEDRIGRVLAPGQALRFIGRSPSPTPATGSYRVHEAEQKSILEEALRGLPRMEGGAPSTLAAAEAERE